MAARRVWAPTVTKARMKAAVPAATKTVIPNLLLTFMIKIGKKTSIGYYAQHQVILRVTITS